MNRRSYHINPAFALRLLVLVILMAVGSRRVEAQATPVYQVKAAFLYHFCRFVDWPPSSNSAFVIGIVGTDPFGPYLDELTKGENVNGKPIVVRRFSDVDGAKGSQILYLGLSDPLEAIHGQDLRGTLTVSETANFAKSGGMVRFFTENNKVRLQINNITARNAGLTISAKLLRISDVIQ